MSLIFERCVMLNNFDFIRFILACCVIIAHSVPLTGNGVSYTNLLTNGQLDLGDLAVDMFFVISGYLIVGSYIRVNNVLKYLYYRILRIIPALILLLIVTFIIIGPILAQQPLHYYFLEHNAYCYLKNAILKKQFALTVFDSYSPTVYHSTMNGSIWTLPLEFTCYCIVAILGVMKLLNKFIMVVLVVLNLYLYINFSTIFHPDVTIFLHPLLWKIALNLHFPLEMWFKLFGYFCAGGCYYFYRSQLEFSKKYLLISALVLLVSCRIDHTMVVMLPIFGSYVLFYLAFHPKIKLHNFAKFGDFSYGIYLYGFFIQQLVIMCYHGHMSNTLNYLISLPLAIIMGALSYYCIERPALNLKKIGNIL